MHFLKKLAPPVFIILIGLTGFIALTNNYFEDDLQGLDSGAKKLIENLKSSELNSWMKILTQAAETHVFVSILLILIIITWRKKKLIKPIITTFLVVLLATASSMYAKKQIRRPRPAYYNLHAPRTYSFPSGHATGALVFYGTFAFSFWKWNIKGKTIVSVFSVILIALVGFSRIYLGVHYASDVLAGYSVGLVIIGLSAFILILVENRNHLELKKS